MSERNLAEAIHAEIIGRGSVETALRVWDDLEVVHPNWDPFQCMQFVLASVASDAIDTVLARRQRGAARRGPWDGGHHFQEEYGYPGSLLPPKRGTP